MEHRLAKISNMPLPCSLHPFPGTRGCVFDQSGIGFVWPPGRDGDGFFLSSGVGITCGFVHSSTPAFANISWKTFTRNRADDADLSDAGHELTVGPRSIVCTRSLGPVGLRYECGTEDKEE